jgi:hypothetical protein
VFARGCGQMLVAANNLHEYFREALSTAMSRTSVRVTENAQAYVVYLLTDFTRSEKVYAGVDHGEKPALAILLSRAEAAEHDEALRIFKHLGDTALYLLGFFKEAAQAQVVAPSYYISMGESAYSSVAKLSREHTSNTAALYAELSDRFSDLVALLHAISLHGEREAQGALLSPGQLLDLIERYKRTQSPELLEVLVQNGVSLKPVMSAAGENTVSPKILLH